MWAILGTARVSARAVKSAASGRAYKMPITRSNPTENSDNWPRCCRPSFPSTSFSSLRSNAGPDSGMVDRGAARRLVKARSALFGWRSLAGSASWLSTPAHTEIDDVLLRRHATRRRSYRSQALAVGISTNARVALREEWSLVHGNTKPPCRPDTLLAVRAGVENPHECVLLNLRHSL